MQGRYLAPHQWILMARYFPEQKDESEAVTRNQIFQSVSKPLEEPHHARAYKFDVVSSSLTLRRKKNFAEDSNRSYE
ncbi:hypothetical protein VNO80_02713 [Phaseolus coccineus]|uniref:Uncharacterized protein n=1 Tax=Phaseolus coccineus TaxID=3886 RepID=A0AAN9NQR8_PHACN